MCSKITLYFNIEESDFLKTRVIFVEMSQTASHDLLTFWYRNIAVMPIYQLFDHLCNVLIQHGLQIIFNDHGKSWDWMALQMFEVSIGIRRH